jgi:CRISPR-associated exonuclease Cas4
MMESMLFEVTDLKQWAYCPRVVYYRYCMPGIRPVTSLMKAGTASHGDEAAREERRSLKNYGVDEGERAFDVEVRSERLGLRGRIDLAIAIPDRQAAGAEAMVVDYKDSEHAAGKHFKLQLAAYAMLLEEHWQLPVRRSYIYSVPLRQAELISINAKLRHEVQQTVTALREAVIGERMPTAPSNRSICVSCEFRRFCNDVV